jgi:peptide deformylase
MFRIMRGSGGVGLAAPQIGINKRIIIFGCGNSLLELINPEISTAEGSISIKEACLSIPGAEVKPKRDWRIRVKGLDRNFKPVRFSLEGLPAVIAQHEIDHLDGILITDYLTPVNRKIPKKPWKKN